MKCQRRTGNVVNLTRSRLVDAFGGQRTSRAKLSRSPIPCGQAGIVAKDVLIASPAGSVWVPPRVDFHPAAAAVAGDPEQAQRRTGPALEVRHDGASHRIRTLSLHETCPAWLLSQLIGRPGSQAVVL